MSMGVFIFNKQNHIDEPCLQMITLKSYKYAMATIGKFASILNSNLHATLVSFCIKMSVKRLIWHENEPFYVSKKFSWLKPLLIWEMIQRWEYRVEVHENRIMAKYSTLEKKIYFS